MRGLIPPSGGKIGTEEISAGLSGMLFASNAPMRLAGIDVPVMGVSSGRAALSAVLKAMAALCPERKVVIVPAYTCYSVAAAVAQAGLMIRLVDVAPFTLAMDPQELEQRCDEHVLAVVHTELCGAIGPVKLYLQMAGNAGAFLVEDSAQAYGSSQEGNAAGTLGDVGIFSVGRGKPIRGISGGMIVTRRSELQMAIADVIAGWSTTGLWKQMLEIAKLCVYRACFHPLWYRLLEGIPALKIGHTEYDPAFKVGRLGSSQRKIAEVAARRSIDECQERRANVQCLTNSLRMRTTYVFPCSDENEAINYPRLPVLAPDIDARNRVIAAMRAKGIGASAMYPRALCCLPALDVDRSGRAEHCRGAEDLARRLFTLPVHGLVERRELAAMRDVLYEPRDVVSLRTGQKNGW